MLAVLWSTPSGAQGLSQSIERVSLALERAAPRAIRLPGPGDEAPTSIGVLTFVPPVFRGEMVRVSLPISDVVSRAMRGIATAHRRRQEGAVRREVQAQLDRHRREQAAQSTR